MTWAFVVGAAAGNTSGHSITTSAVNTTGADLIVICVNGYDGDTLYGVSDNKSNSWTEILREAQGDHPWRMYYCQNPTVGSGHTFTGIGDYGSIGVACYSGSLSSGSLDVSTHTGSTTGGSPFAIGSLTPSQNSSLVVAAMGIADAASSLTYTAPSGFTLRSSSCGSPNPGNWYGVAMADYVQATAASITPSWSNWSNSVPVSVGVVSFKPAPSSFSVSSNFGFPVERIEAIATVGTARIEANSSVAAAIVLRQEVLAKASRSISGAFEFICASAAASTSRLEIIVAARSQLTCLPEEIAAQRSSALAKVESLGAVTTWPSVLAETVASGVSSFPDRAEILAGVRSQPVARIETLAGVATFIPVPIEFLGNAVFAVSSKFGALVEWAGSVSRTLTSPAERLGALSAALKGQIEEIAAQRGLQTVPIEDGTAVQVFGRAPLESVSGISMKIVDPIEMLGTSVSAVSSSFKSVVEILGGAGRAIGAPAERLGGIARSVPVPAETASRIAAAMAARAESLLAVRGGSLSAAIETLVLVSARGAICIAWDGTSVVLVIDPSAVLLSHLRKTAFVSQHRTNSHLSG